MTGDTGAPRRLAYQPALDGLRALAVLAVVLYHDRTIDLPGGFLGVDVFFVLSGFLITGILLVDHASHGSTVSAGFWLRRARRLIPAFIVLLLLAAAYTAFVSRSGHPAEVRAQGIAGLFYVANWQAIYSSDFAPTILSHIWSLSVEEQWYLVWPFLLAALLVLARRSRRVLAVAIVALACASAVWMGYAANHITRSRAFFGTDTRAWELLAGAALAVALQMDTPPSARRRVIIQAAGLAGIVGIAWSIATFHDTDLVLYPTGRIVIVASTMAVIAASILSGGPIRRALGWRPFVIVGLLSYGIYLYHVPLFAWTAEEHTGVHGAALLALRLVVVFAFAGASYLLVEMPIRRGALRRLGDLRWVAVPLVVVVATVALIGSTSVARQPDQYALALIDYQRLADSTPPGTTRLLVAGDATAFHLGWRYHLPYERDGVRGTVASTVQCGLVAGTPLVGDTPLGRPTCRPWQEVYRDAVDRFDPAVTALMVGNTEMFDRRIGDRVLRVPSAALRRHFEHRLEAARRVLTAGGRPMILISVPCADPDTSVDPAWAGIRRQPERIAWVNGIFRGFAARHRGSVTFEDLDTVLCPGGNPHPAVGTLPLRPDGVTLSAVGASVVWQWLAPIARDAASLPHR